MKYEIYKTININDDEIDAVSRGHLKKKGKFVCLLAQNDHFAVYGIQNRNGDLLVLEAGYLERPKLRDLCYNNGWKEVPNEVVGSCTILEIPANRAEMFRKIRRL